MLKHLLSAAAAVLVGLLPAKADVTPTFTPDPSQKATNLAEIKIELMLNTPTADSRIVKLVNETTNTTYQCVKVENGGTWGMKTAVLKFGTEGTMTALDRISDDGIYKLSIPAGFFSGIMSYTSPLIEATYTIGNPQKNEMAKYVLTPAAGEVSQINSVKVDFPDTGLMGIKVNSTDGITLTYNDGASTRVAKVVKHVYTFGTDCGLQFDWEDAEVKEPMTFVAPGTYTLDIPAGAFAQFSGTPTNSRITATYTIAAKGGAMADCTVTPAAGEVTEIKTVTLTFGNSVSALRFADDLSAITISRKGDIKTVWHCIEAAVSADNESAAVLTFAREGGSQAASVNAPGEYVLTVPAGMVSGTTADGTMSNDGIQALYTIKEGVNNMLSYTVAPAGEVVTEIDNVVVSFGDVQDGVQYTSDFGAISLVFAPETSGETVTYTPSGCQIKGNEVTVVFKEAPFTAAGTYVFTVPEGLFTEYGNSASSNPAIEKTFVIEGVAVGVGAVMAEEGGADVYNLQGVLVRRAGDDRQLPAGVYVSAGRKIVVMN